MSVSVGIDLGTTYSAVAYVPEGENTPKIIIYSSHYFSNYNWKKVVKLPVNTML